MVNKVFVTSDGEELQLEECLGTGSNTMVFRYAGKVMKIVGNHIGEDFSILFARLAGVNGLPKDLTTFIREVIEAHRACGYAIPDMTDFSAGFGNYSDVASGEDSIYYYTQPFIAGLTENDRDPQNGNLPIKDSCDTGALKEILVGGKRALMLLDWDKLLLACLLYAKQHGYGKLLDDIKHG